MDKLIKYAQKEKRQDRKGFKLTLYLNLLAKIPKWGAMIFRNIVRRSEVPTDKYLERNTERSM